VDSTGRFLLIAAICMFAIAVVVFIPVLLLPFTPGECATIITAISGVIGLPVAWKIDKKFEARQRERDNDPLGIRK
jgi:hypothetical protein